MASILRDIAEDLPSAVRLDAKAALQTYDRIMTQARVRCSSRRKGHRCWLDDGHSGYHDDRYMQWDEDGLTPRQRALRRAAGVLTHG